MALTPPKPKELDSAIFTRRVLVARARLGKLQAASGVSNAISGGSHCSRRAIRQTAASTAPAAPSRWPMLAFVELTGKVARAIARPTPDGGGLRAVVERRAGAVGVEVINVRRRHAGHLAGLGHRGQRRVALRMRLGEMVQIDGCAVAGEFAENDRAASARASRAFPAPSGRRLRQCARPSRCASKGRQSVGESACKRVEAGENKLVESIVTAGEHPLGATAAQ